MRSTATLEAPDLSRPQIAPELPLHVRSTRLNPGPLELHGCSQPRLCINQSNHTSTPPAANFSGSQPRPPTALRPGKELHTYTYMAGHHLHQGVYVIARHTRGHGCTARPCTRARGPHAGKNRAGAGGPCAATASTGVNMAWLADPATARVIAVGASASPKHAESFSRSGHRAVGSRPALFGQYYLRSLASTSSINVCL